VSVFQSKGPTHTGRSNGKSGQEKSLERKTYRQSRRFVRAGIKKNSKGLGKSTLEKKGKGRKNAAHERRGKGKAVNQLGVEGSCDPERVPLVR